jgi:hypothetical protein
VVQGELLISIHDNLYISQCPKSSDGNDNIRVLESLYIGMCRTPTQTSCFSSRYISSWGMFDFFLFLFSFSS